MRAELVRQVWPEQYDRPVSDATTGARIHEEKFTDAVFDGLESRGLAARSSDYGWWTVEPRTAGVYMAYLAATLGTLDEVGMDPISDTTELFVPTPDTPVARAEALRLGMLEAVLPGPDEPVAVSELVRFKERHAGELRAFRLRIEQELLRIAQIEDEGVRARGQTLTEEQLRLDIDGIAAEMRQRRWPKILFGTIAGLAAVAATGAAAIGTGGAAVVLAAPGVISGAYAAVQGLPQRQRSRSPLAYAAMAQKSFAR
jgi:hypothetical protein